jgi:tetratricopeptide (TPR) repeat protein
MLKQIIINILFLSILFALQNNTKYEQEEIKQINKPIYKPLIERYILDELKSIRLDNQKLREDLTKQVTKSEVTTSDRAISYVTDTISNIFYIIALGSSIILVVGFKSLKDIKDSSEKLVEKKINKLTQDFEERLLKIETKARQRYKIINETQSKLLENETVSSLWRRSELEESLQEKINLYDEITKIQPDCVEALTYKADALLELNETRWALSLSNQALELDNNYAFAYWQRACSNATLNNVNDSIEDIKKSLEISPNLQEELKHEDAFRSLYDNDEFKKLLDSSHS